MFKINELDINYFVKLAESHVGEIHNLKFQSYRADYAGKYEILEFVPDNPHFDYNYWMSREDETPDTAKLGYYLVKITESKFYNGKTIRVPVSAYVQEDDKITNALYIGHVNLDTGKSLKAYQFGILDFRKYK
jgi:hypothetical protein